MSDKTIELIEELNRAIAHWQEKSNKLQAENEALRKELENLTNYYDSIDCDRLAPRYYALKSELETVKAERDAARYCKCL